VWIVTASFKATGVPRPKSLALGTEHLITAFGFVNKNFAIRARFSVGLEKSDRSERVMVANMKRIITSGLEFPAKRASEFVTCGTLPSGRDEAIAIGISTAMNE
jgi:hypothetical protein